MRIVVVSDTHNFLAKLKVPYGDVLVHCGDLTRGGTAEEMRQFNLELGTLPHPHKVVVGGNHDGILQDDPEFGRAFFDLDCHYLQDESVTINGVKFYGSPWVTGRVRANFNAFWAADGSAKLCHIRKTIPADTTVLVTHCPPYGILDEYAPGQSAGCVLLRERVEEIKPRLSCFGHVHLAYGQIFDKSRGIHYINASSCTTRYEPINQPVVFDLV
jgi:Icc-related predicted phosphoesterase